MYQLNIFQSKIHSLGTFWRSYKCMYGVCVFLALDFYLVGSPTAILIWDNEKRFQQDEGKNLLAGYNLL